MGPNNGLPLETFGHLEQPYDNVKFNKLYKIVPLDNTQKLILSWSLPSLQDKYKFKIHKYLARLIGHEGKGSLFSLLKKHVWVVSLYAGYENWATHSEFEVSITLTKDGMKNIDMVIRLVFSYLSMIKSQEINEKIFDEMKEISKLDFDFEQECSPVVNVEWLSKQMLLYPSELINTVAITYEYNEEMISSILNELRTDNVCILLVSRDFADQCDKVEPL